ncbi:hypothetical protein J7J37_02110 [bacterium]|nr:hypothetical protein [bacterium]
MKEKERISIESFNAFWEAVILPKRKDSDKDLDKRDKNLDKSEVWEKVRILPLTEAVEFLFSLADRRRE